MLVLNNISILNINLNTIFQYTFKLRIQPVKTGFKLNWNKIKITNKLIVKLILINANEHLKNCKKLIAKNITSVTRV